MSTNPVVPPRPRTAVPSSPSGESSETEIWSDEEDDDPGMFSFLPPSPTTTPPAPPPPPPRTPSSPVAPHGSPPAGAAHRRHLTLQTPADNEGLTPAAAYALAAQRHIGADGGWVQGPGPRKRGSWQFPGSPTYVVDPLQQQQQHHGDAGESVLGSHRVLSFEEDGKRSTVRSVRSAATSSDGGALGGRWSNSQGTSMYDTEMRDFGNKPSIQHRMEQADDADKYYDGDGDVRGATETTVPLSYYDGTEEDSPFAEVRASVSNLDDPEMPCVTFRSIFLGILFSCVMGAVNECVFSFSFLFPLPLLNFSPHLLQILLLSSKIPAQDHAVVADRTICFSTRRLP